MALGMWLSCPCGEHVKMYIAKSQVFGPMTSKAVDWQTIDAREEAEGGSASGYIDLANIRT